MPISTVNIQVRADSVLQTQLERNKAMDSFSSAVHSLNRVAKPSYRATIKKRGSSAQTALRATVRDHIVTSFAKLTSSRATVRGSVVTNLTFYRATVRGSIVTSFTNLTCSMYYQLILTVQGQGGRSLEDAIYDSIIGSSCVQHEMLV